MFQIGPNIRLYLNWSIDYLGTLATMVKEKPPGKTSVKSDKEALQRACVY